MRTVVVIPARLGSSRLPRKVLADIAGKPMVQHVYERCARAARVHAVYIATDSEEVAAVVRSFGGTAWMTDPALPSGTARVASIVSQLDAEVIINVQGDEPLITPAVVEKVAAAFDSTPVPDIATPIFPLRDAEVFNPNTVKVVLGHDRRALYFSRSPIPYVRDVEQARWPASAPYWGHIGVYGFRRQVLLDFGSMRPSPLEDAEKLEQLRWLQDGRRILTVDVDYRPQPVDVAADLERVRDAVRREAADARQAR